MRLSITRRLTLTSALLGSVVLLPPGWAVHQAVKHVIELRGARSALEGARRAADAVLRQWDEEFLLEFGKESVFFQGIEVGFPDWTVVRPGGRAEWAAGAFAGDLVPEAGPVSRRVMAGDGRPLRIASVPLVEPVPLSLESLPAPARAAIEAERPGAPLVSIKREMASSSAVLEVKVLEGSRIHEIKLTADGKVRGRGSESLPALLSESLLHFLPLPEGCAAGPPSWAAHGGQLLAVVELKGPGEASWRVAMNRLGELFAVSASGEVGEADPASRLHVAVAIDAAGEAEALQGLHGSLWLGGGLAWGLLVFAGWFVARRAMAPVKDMVRAARGIEVSRLSERLPVPPADDELSRIAETINAMLERIEEGYRRQRRFTGDASHELRTPLAKVVAEIDLALSRDRTAEDYRGTLERCKGYTAGLHRLVEDLLLLARLDDEASRPPPEPFDLGALAAEAVSAVPPEERERVQLRLEETPEPLLALGHRSLAGVLVRNLLENALRHAPGPVRVEARRQGEGVVLLVVDRGPGIPPEVLARVLDRFFRLDASRSRETGGAGLGLSIAQAIARIHGSSIDLRPGPGGGTVASIIFAVHGPRPVEPPGR